MLAALRMCSTDTPRDLLPTPCRLTPPAALQKLQLLLGTSVCFVKARSTDQVYSWAAELAHFKVTETRISAESY